MPQQGDILSKKRLGSLEQ